MNTIFKDLVEHFRCPESVADLPTEEDSALGQRIDDLRCERYFEAASAKAAAGGSTVIRNLYYGLRPLLSVRVRKWAQRAYLSGWQRIQFPHWPVDFTVEGLLRQALVAAMRAHGLRRVPFVWFWPDGKMACLLMTHDVETAAGRDSSTGLMDLDDQYEIKSSFQVIPAGRYEVTPNFLDCIRERGFEVNVHDLTHRGNLFREHRRFLQSASEINKFGRRWKALGFRSGALYRRQEWFDALEFEYDMSVPNVAHFEPQRGGCCTVFPYFIGDLLEIPLTATQDYSLFHILNDYSTKVWEQQIRQIVAQHGLVSFIVHPDYLREDRARRCYTDLLVLLKKTRESDHVWIPTPGQLNRWWRARQKTSPIKVGSEWLLQGPAAEQANLAYASLEADQITVEIKSPKAQPVALLQ